MNPMAINGPLNSSLSAAAATVYYNIHVHTLLTCMCVKMTLTLAGALCSPTAFMQVLAV